MRTIKFRGKRLDNGEWVYGDLLQTENKQFEKEFRIIDWAEEPYNHAVDPATIGQFTGLLDKHGKEIWEGDIVKTTERIGICEFHFGIFLINDHDKNTSNSYSDSSQCWDVLGNIHDNHELLTK